MAKNPRVSESFDYTETLLLTWTSHLRTNFQLLLKSHPKLSLANILAEIMKLSWTIVLTLVPVALAQAPVPVPCSGNLPDLCTTKCVAYPPFSGPPPTFEVHCTGTCVNLKNDPKNCGCCGKVVSPTHSRFFLPPNFFFFFFFFCKSSKRKPFPLFGPVKSGQSIEKF